MIPQNRKPNHPGEVLYYEFLKPAGITQAHFARHLGISTQRLNEIIKGKRGVSSETAWLLSQALGSSPEFWLNLQINYDLYNSKPDSKIKRIKLKTNDDLAE